MTWPVLRAGLEARARLTRALDLAFECLEDVGALFLRLDEALALRRAVADEGFRDEERAVRGAFFLFKSFSLLESRDPSQVLGNSSGTFLATAF
jgi:hypothetical protein